MVNGNAMMGRDGIEWDRIGCGDKMTQEWDDEEERTPNNNDNNNKKTEKSSECYTY